MDFPRFKLKLVFWIMGLGLFLALVWNDIQGGILGRTYPYTTFLFIPQVRFSDFTDALFISGLSNPYDDPYAFYLPFTWLCLRPLAALPTWLSLLSLLFITLSGLVLLLARCLQPLLPSPRQRVCFAFALVGFSYPVLICVDRGNIEILLALLVAGALYCFSRNRYGTGMLWLLPAICLKLYPVIFLALLARQRRMLAVTVCLAACAILTFLSLNTLALPYRTAWELYQRDLAFFTNTSIYENLTLEGSASPWNAYKVGLLAAADLGWIAPVDFSFGGRLITISYAFYALGTACFIVGLCVYVCFLEKEFARCAAVLLLAVSIATPSGADYRLLYACLALVPLVLLKTKRPHDLLVLVLVTLTLVPKKEFFLTFAGKTESGFPDVSIQVVLNPLMVFAALLLLLYDGWPGGDFRWPKLRLLNWRRAIGKWR